MTTAADRLPDSIAAALRDLKARLHAHYADRLAEVRLYGSYARGEAGPESDVDVLVVVDTVRQLSDRTAAMELGFDVMLETGLPIEVQVLGRDELQFLRRTEALLAKNLDRDGIVV